MTISQAAEKDTEQDYQQYMLALRNYASKNVEGRKLFTTNANGLFEIYLNSLPYDQQHYNCHTCRKFIEKYGGLVFIGEDGELIPFLWNMLSASVYFNKSITSLGRAVIKGKITGVHFDDSKVWGTPQTGEWTHLHVIPPQDHIFKSLVKTPHQASAEKTQDYININKALNEYPVAAVNQAVAILKQNQLTRSEKVLGAAEWLQKLHNDSAVAIKQFKSNVIWLAVANAPSGFCHPRSSMIGSLLDDIIEGVPFDSIARRFADKMNPEQYQRPQAMPSAGNIMEAERIVEKLGIAKSLERRFARFDELQTLWTPKEIEAETPNGVFGHLDAKDVFKIQQLDTPPQKTTWLKFSNEVLPNADFIDCLVPRWGSFTAILTATNFDAPPILQWDIESQRNPFSTYVYTKGSSAETWGLKQLEYCQMTGICYQPSMWNHNPNTHHGKGVIFLLEGARDAGYRDMGNAIFPEHLKSEMYGIRSTIEAYSQKAIIDGADESTANGIAIGAGSGVIIKVKTGDIESKYIIDRWD